MSETLLCALFLAVIFISLFVILAVLIEILDELKDIRVLSQRIKELERWADSQYDKQRKTRKSHRENRRNQRFVTETDIANQGERDLIGTPYWWLQFCYDENLKQENPVLYTILEAFAKDEQRRYKEENEVFK